MKLINKSNWCSYAILYRSSTAAWNVERGRSGVHIIWGTFIVKSTTMNAINILTKHKHDKQMAQRSNFQLRSPHLFRN